MSDIMKDILIFAIGFGCGIVFVAYSLQDIELTKKIKYTEKPYFNEKGEIDTLYVYHFE